ncbi:MAG TPA: hypothetical protein VI299_00760 [Polyangiales bacterium]
MSELSGPSHTVLYATTDQDLRLAGVTDSARVGTEIVKQLFEGLHSGIKPYALTPELMSVDEARLGVDARKLGRSWFSRKVEYDEFALFAFRAKTVLCIQYVAHKLYFRRGLLSNITLFHFSRARGPGGYSVTCTFSSDHVPPTQSPRIRIGPDGSENTATELSCKSFSFDVDYHLSDAGAYRVLSTLMHLGQFIDVPVRLERASDC